ncbi:MAG: hypothetical protein QOF71_3133 [Candidatus Eremiobacteraeota bacterium]|nr:hypothetical protein [Candidatus Eremiobacteraeota bacterium]
MAEQQGLYGRVDVVVSLDAASRIVGTRVLRSPAGILNQAAITAAQASLFQTEIRNCRTIASDLIYSVDFPEKITYATTPSGARTISVLADATVTRAADVAHVEARIATIDDSAARAQAKNDAIFEALKAKLRALGIFEPPIRATRSVHGIPSPVSYETPPPRPGEGNGFEAIRDIDVTIDTATSAGEAAVAASSIRSVDVQGIRYTLADYASAYREARDIALKDAELSAQRNVTPRLLQLGAVLRIDAPRTEPGGPPSQFRQFHRWLSPEPPPTAAVPMFEVRATVTVTYAIKP